MILKKRKNLVDARLTLEDLLLQDNRWADVSYLYPEPDKSIIDSYEQLQEFRKFASAEGKNSNLAKDFAKEYNPFNDEVSTIYAAFLAAGRDDIAKSIADQAFKLENTPDLKIKMLKKAKKANQFRWWHLWWQIESSSPGANLELVLKIVMPAFIVSTFCWILLLQRNYLPVICCLLVFLLNLWQPENPSYWLSLTRSLSIPIFCLIAGIPLLIKSIRLNKPVLKYNQGDVEAALKETLAELEKRPNDFDLLSLASTFYNSLSKYEKALEYSEKCIAIRSSNPLGYQLKALAFLGMNKLNEACDELKSGATRFRFFDAYFKSAFKETQSLISAMQNNKDDSMAFLKDVGIGKHFHPFYFLLMDSYIFLLNGEIEKASESMTKLLKMRMPPAYLASAQAINARILLKQDKLDKALESSNMALHTSKVSGNFAIAGLIKTRMNQPEQGLELIQKAIDLNPYNVEAYHFRAETYIALKEPEKAAEDKLRVQEMGDCKTFLS
ncbi:MAG: hypothetical protein IPG59_23150 [Candidatus Melainabacteria bacterium]|nr:MAG: hypothetical protein IPG59_23150 [Candidatus Melainabacteria bacterium]